MSHKDIDEEVPHWAMYPTNVHMATKGKKSGGASLQTKKVITAIGLVILVVALTIAGYMGGNNYGFGLLSGAISLVLSIILAMFIYSKLMRDKLNESFESDPNNKVLKLFRIRLNDGEQERIDKRVDIMSYTSGELFITLRIEIGHSNFASQEATREFLDQLFKSAHQLQLKIKNYNTLAEWRKSDVYHDHLRRLTKVNDPKLRGTLADIDAHQANIFDKGQVNSMQIVFITRRNNLQGLEAIVTMVDDWQSERSHLTSVRLCKWLTHAETVNALCQFLTIEMLDVASNMNKKNVKYDVRKLVKVYSHSRFDPEQDIEIESKSTTIRKDRRKKKR